MAESRRVASVNEVPPGGGTVVEVDGKQIALFNVEGVIYALDNACTHRGGPLGEGNLWKTIVNCPWHGAQYDLTNGRALSPPAPSDVTSYPTKVEDDGVWLFIA